MSGRGFILIGGIAEMLDRATPPAECGPEMPIAPARGPMLRFTPREVVRTDAGSMRVQRSGYRGRDAARVADAFDLMAAQAQRAGAAGAAFTVAQIEAGRAYAALTERVAASGVRCSSVEALRAASGGGGCFEQAMLDDFARLRRMHAKIGTGLAKEVRRLRPSQHGGVGRREIRVRDLVDQVCLGGMTLSQVLKNHGWRKTTKSLEGLRKELRAALDRLAS